MAFYNDRNNPYNIVSSFSVTPLYDFGVFSRGYHSSAKILAERLLSANGFGDHEGYPIVFLYRHAFELSMKDIIYRAKKLLSSKEGLDDGSHYYNTHNLETLEKELCEYLKKLFPNDNDLLNLCEEIKTVSKEFHDIDLKSFSYRYPIDNQGEYSNNENQIINIESVYENMNKLLDTMNGVSLAISSEVDSLRNSKETL